MIGPEGWVRVAGSSLAVVALVCTGPAPFALETPTEAPNPLAPLLEQLSRRAALYEKAALGFSCDETVLVGKFSGRTGENRKEEKTLYNYLYEGNPGTGFEEIRILQDRNDLPQEARIAEPGLPVPGAYDWALLFTERHRPYFRFESAGEERVGFHVTRIVAFQGAATWNRGRRIEEWSGKVWVDRETGNFVKILAAPNRQEELLPLRMTKWLKGIRLGGLPLKKQPRGYRYQLSFTVEKFGLTFPGEAVTRLFVLTLQGEEEIRERISQDFDNYVFYNARSEEEFLGSAPAPQSPPKR
jgi:hypothetical protein